MSKDEKAAAKEWKAYMHETGSGKSLLVVDSNYDGFFAGFYAGRDYQRDKEPDRVVANKFRDAVHKVLHGVGSSKAEKTKRGSALTQR